MLLQLFLFVYVTSSWLGVTSLTLGVLVFRLTSQLARRLRANLLGMMARLFHGDYVTQQLHSDMSGFALWHIDCRRGFEIDK